jgi:hypothetical protein
MNSKNNFIEVKKRHRHKLYKTKKFLGKIFRLIQSRTKIQNIMILIAKMKIYNLLLNLIKKKNLRKKKKKYRFLMINS